MKILKKAATLLTVTALLATLVACGGTKADETGADATPSAAQPTATQGPTTTPALESGLPTTDPGGNAISIPQEIRSIVTLAPSLSQTVVDLGLGNKIIGYDLNSVGLAGLNPEAPTFDTVSPDVEGLLALAPDVLLVTNLSLYDQEAPFQPLMDAGICVICVPTSESLADVKSDISFLASALGVPAQGDAILNDLQAKLDGIAEIAAQIPQTERKTVYFEISAAPSMYSTGAGTYLHELIELIGAENILADVDGWCSVEAESIVSADPDVILTNVNYLEDPVGEILSRDGWAGITAVKNKAVYSIDNNASSQPNKNIVLAAQQMASAVYPEYFGAFPESVTDLATPDAAA